MIYLDTNVVVAACTNTENSEQVGRLFRGEEPLYVSRLADYEARKCLASLDPAAESDLNLLFLEKFSTGKEWEAAILQALKLSRHFKERLWVDSADTLHVGWALSIGADVFASFDRESGPRALAKAAGLKVWPPENAKDYAKRKLVKS
jgi:predicted nucleic acid-binding protein